MFIGLMVLTNLIYMVKIALEMNLGFGAFLINFLDCCHMFILEVALAGYSYSTLTKRNFKIDLLDNTEHVNMSMFIMVDVYSMIAINMLFIFYPFRIFAFISRFNFSTAIRGTLNSIVRMSPGLATYFTIVLIVGVIISISNMLILSPIIPEMNTFVGAFYMTLTVNFFELQTIQDIITVPNSTPMILPMIIFLFQSLINFGMVVFMALTVYLFSKSIVFEKSVSVENQDEQDQTDTISEIHDKVC